MNHSHEQDEDENEPKRQRDIEAAEAAAVDEMFASMKANNTTTGTGWFITPLKDMHLSSIQVGDRFYCEPRSRDLDPRDVPEDHPFRAILTVLNSAKEKLKEGDTATLRVYAYSLSCPYMIDTLIHYRKFFNVQVIINPTAHSLSMMKKFVDNIPVSRDTGSPRAGLEMIQIRVADVSQHETTSMHRKELISEDLITVGSYNYSLSARCFNWETIFIADTRDDDILRFDALWADLDGRALQVYNPDANLFPAREQKNLAKFKGSLPQQVAKKDVFNPYKKIKE